MTSFRLNNGFRLQKTNRAAIRWKQPPKKPFHHVSRDKILHDSWSISAALARGFSDRHFERGEGPGDEVDFSVLSKILSRRDFVLFAVLSVTKKSFNILILLGEYVTGEKIHRSQFTLKTSNDFQKPMKFARFIPLTHVRQISEPVQLFDLKCFPFPPIKDV